MCYFALLVPNTGLAKAGVSAWWAQGFTYLWNFVAPYTLWLPLLLAVPFVAQLSDQDFGATAARIAPSGVITAP